MKEIPVTTYLELESLFCAVQLRKIRFNRDQQVWMDIEVVTKENVSGHKEGFEMDRAKLCLHLLFVRSRKSNLLLVC